MVMLSCGKINHKRHKNISPAIYHWKDCSERGEKNIFRLLTEKQGPRCNY